MGSSVPLLHPTGPVGASWLVSGLLHAALAIAAFFFVRHLQLAPQTEPFQWDVTMVAPLSSSGRSTPLAQPTTPLSPAVQESPTSKPVSPTASAMKPVMPRPDVSPTPTSIVESASEPHRKKLSQHQQTQSSPAPAQSAISPPDVTPQHLLTPPSEQATPPHEVSPAVVDSQATAESPLAASSPASAPVSSVDQLKSAKTDYGWLAAIMAQWIEDLNKRYPAMLRTEGVEGKVTLAAILHEGGQLTDVRIVKSSGHAALDQVAVEDVTNGPPITLIHPLNRTRIPVKFSISYDLKTAR